jgi:hypothetical protein
MDTNNVILAIIAVLIMAFVVVGIPLLIVFAVLRVRKYVKTRKEIPPKEQLARETILKILGDTVHYDPAGKLANDPKESGLLRYFSKQDQDDHIFGQYKGLEFEQADVHFEHWRSEQRVVERGDETDVVNETVWYTVFSGRWMVVKSPKTVTGRVLVFNKTAYVFEKKRFEQPDTPYTPVELEDMEFNSMFTVVAENPQDAFYAITPNFIERLKSLALIEPSDENVEIYVGFYGSTIHIGFGNVVRSFDYIRVYARDEADAWNKAYEDLRLPVSILESLL